MEEFAICIQDLKKTYSKNAALKGINLKIHENELIGLIGANGSGKTTLFKICSGFEAATAGTVTMFGMDPVMDIRMKEEVIYSMHNLPVGGQQRLCDILKFYDMTYPHFDRIFAQKLLELFGLNLKKRCSALSQGMKSLLHFACALATRCKVTMFDEPFIGIDIEKRKLAYEVLLRDYMEHPRTILVSSHNLSELEGVLSEMILIHEGELIFYKEMDEVREMLFRIDGSEEEISRFVQGKEVLRIVKKELGSYAIVKGSVSGVWAGEAEEAGLTVSRVSPEDVSVYLTQGEKGKELETLWEN